MPHLNIDTFLNQFSWIIIVFSISYFFAANNYSLKIIFKIRN